MSSFRRVCFTTGLVFLLITYSVCLRAQTHTLSTYTELLTYSGTADSVYVDHDRYHGWFVKGSCDATDNGTAFKTETTCWQRVYNNFHPRFWDIGRTSLWDGKTVVKEADAINSAVFAAWQAGGDTVEIDRMYEIDRYILLLEKVTYLGTADSAGFRRAVPPKTILTDTAKVGDKFIEVLSNEGFRSFQEINIASDIRYDSLPRFKSYRAGINPVLTGDDLIALSGAAISRQMLPGDSVSLFFPMMRSLASISTDSITIKNLVFDGNRDDYSLNYDWRVNSTILFLTNSGSLIDHCRFYNITSENLVLCGTDVRNSSGVGFNGSALHFSCNAQGSPTSILYNDFSNLNEVGDDVMAHSEAGFTFSARVRNFHMAYNQLSQVAEHGIGNFGNDDTTNVITDNLLETIKEEVFIPRPFYLYEETNQIYNNKNPAKADLSVGDCFRTEPSVLGSLPCNAGTTTDKPLTLGDTLTLKIDSLFVVNSNEGFIKAIIPLQENEFFDLIGASVKTPETTVYHEWFFEQGETERLVFNNGHRNGQYGKGNWGYELCGTPGGCNEIELLFRVKKTPRGTAAVPCPLQGLKVLYDSDLDTWGAPVLCDNEPVYFDQEALGQPFLSGGGVCSAPVDLYSDEVSQSSVYLNWSGVVQGDSYLIWFKEPDATRWKRVVQRGSLNRKKLIRLKVDTEYVWKMQGRCGDDWGEFSEEKRFVTGPIECAEVNFRELSADPILSDVARLNWERFDNRWYLIRWRKSGDKFWKNALRRPSKRYWIRKLKPETSYEWQIKALCNGEGESSWSDMQAFTTSAKVAEDSEYNPGIVHNEVMPIPDDLTIQQETIPTSKLQIFPNPAKSEVQVRVAESEIKSIRIANLQGILVYQHMMPEGRHLTSYLVPLNGLPKGVYLLMVLTEDGLEKGRLIIE